MSYPNPKPNPRPLRADAARNRQALLTAAAVAFARHGVSASLDEVARAAGVGPGTLYRHFPTRDQLVRAVIDDGLCALRDHGESLLQASDSVAALTEWLEAYIGQGNVYDGLARTLVDVESDGEGVQSCRAARQAGAQLIARAVARGAIRSDADADDILDLAAGIAWVGQQPDRDENQRVRLVRLLVDGLQVTDSTTMRGQP
ncbi:MULTISPECIES: TetR/AcrR family transcriptional regulator [unclassified Mycolicibacterium]|uniref:TetR/AcrR family transcriptional regulator n=1 Tax=unclassified Mycolicibacterium TaxID=2636767 RepID=UPI001443F067|nr:MULTISPECIES: TetR/AcrR family transcriptional regulator [unclassified Mycolicibacterium]